MAVFARRDQPRAGNVNPSGGDRPSAFVFNNAMVMEFLSVPEPVADCLAVSS